MKSPLLEQVSYFKVISTILYIFHLHISPAREICITRDVIFLENKEFHDGEEQDPVIFHNNGDEGGPEDFLGSVGKEPTKLPSVAKTVGEKYISVCCSCLMPDDSR